MNKGMKFDGNIDDLKDLLQKKGVKGTWDKKGVSNQFRSLQGGIVNLFDNGTVNFQGQSPDKDKLKDIIESYTGEYGSVADTAFHAPEPSPAYQTEKPKVFVVYGHDTQSREQLELVLHKLNLNPFVLANTSGNGLTIIEELEAEIVKNNTSNCKFGIVLLTPDDMGYSKADGAEKAEPRARQNVVLEMGMLISSLGRKNVVILKKGHLEVPSDANGIIYLAFNDHVKEVVPKLVDRLQASGFYLESRDVANASS
jgi:predicted nucleotide-binding protein